MMWLRGIEALTWATLTTPLTTAETGLPVGPCPEACPWTPEQVLAEDFWPEVAEDGA
jgi:hypothetical protein